MSQDLSNISPDVILNTARDFVQQNEYGKACSYYLLLYHNDPDLTQEIKSEFLFAFEKWLTKLLHLGGLKEAISFYETSREVCHFLTGEIVLVASKVLFQAEYILDACKLLSTCKTQPNKDIYYDIQQSKEQLCNMLVHRWHFRMLNDKRRNLAYSLAIKRAYENGHRDILDIGSGTGILSLFASRSGFEKIYSIEASEVMFDVQKKTITENNGRNIKLINDFSTDLDCKKDIDKRSSLLVTEIFDCGLVGEGVIKTMKHALKNLLSEDCQVIPYSADIYGVCIECEELRKHKSYSYQNKMMFYGSKDPGDMKDQPYTTENMKTIKNGYRNLSKPFKLKTLNFLTLDELTTGVDKTEKMKIPVEQSGVLDAIMVYFILHLDERISITSEPDADSCWEQALYNVNGHKTVASGDFVNLQYSCCEEYFVITVLENSDFTTLHTQPNNNITSVKTLNINRRSVARLNDKQYIDTYTERICEVLQEKKNTGKKKLNICMICNDISILPFEVLQEDQHCLYLVEPSLLLLEMLASNQIYSHEQIKILTRPLMDVLSTDGLIFDVVISEPIDHNGLIKENFIEDFTFIKSLACCINTSFIPSCVETIATFITSTKLLRENRVLDENVTLGLKIHTFINEYTVSTHPDVDALPFLNGCLSKPFSCGVINLEKESKSTEDLNCFNCSEYIVDIVMESSGDLTGLITWHNLQFGSKYISTKPSEKTHWHQSCVVFPKVEKVTEQKTISLRTIRLKSLCNSRPNTLV